MMQIAFGEKLRACREERGMTQQTLADKLYVTRQAVSRWECGARYPDLVTAKRIAEELGISLDELVSGEKYVRDIEKEPVIMAPVPLLLQTALYAAAGMPFLLICLLETIGVMPRDALHEAERLQMNAWLAEVMACNFIYL
ncbi:MAG: helix-turn-helix domain-containing protein, partial [Eubacterium sp.]|nr:helix-turn-helix domain-containing protein [Eubacterium sp.]